MQWVREPNSLKQGVNNEIENFSHFGNFGYLQPVAQRTGKEESTREASSARRCSPSETSSTCGTSSTCVVGADATLAGGIETIAAQSFAPGTYGLYVDSFYSTAAGSGAYDLSVTGTLPVEVTDFSVE